MLRRPEESEEEDDEDETAELLRELEKIKRERAEEKERQVDKFVQRIVFLSDDFPRSAKQVPKLQRNVLRK